MKHTRVASYVPSPYSKNSPSMKYKPDIKKNSISGEASSKPSKPAQADSTSRPQSQHGGHDILEKKFSPILIDRKNDFTTSLYQLAKGLDKDRQTYSKLYRSRETQQQQPQVQQKKITKPSSRQSDKTPSYQCPTSKSKKPDDYKSVLNISNQASSRISSRMIGHDEQNESILQKVSDNLLSTKRALAGTGDMSGSKSKAKNTPSHQKSLSNNFFKGTQRTPVANESKQITNFQPSANNLSFNEVSSEKAKTPDPRKADAHNKSSNAGGGNSFNDALAHKLKIALQGLQGDLQNAKHRRGLSSGQAPIFIDQQIIAQERQEKVKPIEFVPQDPQQEQDDFYQQFFHSDKMTFDFEKLIVSQRNKIPNGSSTTSVTPTNKPATAHTRTRSIEDPNSLLPTKASSRWNTKRSSVGDDVQTGGREMFNLIEQISDLDKTEFEKEELRRYLRG